jgi:RimJ/RimL family protein N-acetyltransferase
MDASKTRLRLATADDLLLYFEWANDADVRRNSFTHEPISLVEHEAWFARNLASPDVLMLVVESSGTAVGQIRFDVDGAVATISFALAASARGRGLGRQLLRDGVRYLHASFPTVRVARGLVQPGNVASRRAFEAAGFAQVQRGPEEARWLVYDIQLGA